MEDRSQNNVNSKEAIVDKAVDLYRERRFNCAESIMIAFAEGLELGVPPEVIRSTTPLGGGIGQSGEACGALTSGVLVVGLLHGRTDAGADRAKAFQAAKTYRDRFAQHLGSTLCRDLNFMDFTSSDHRPRCSQIVATAAGLLFDVVEESDRNG